MFVDVTPEERELAEKLARNISKSGLECTADDILLAKQISLFAERRMQDSKELRTKLTRKLFALDSARSQAQLVTLAQLLRRLYNGEFATFNDAVLGFADAELAVLATIDVNGYKHPKG